MLSCRLLETTLELASPAKRSRDLEDEELPDAKKIRRADNNTGDGHDRADNAAASAAILPGLPHDVKKPRDSRHRGSRDEHSKGEDREKERRRDSDRKREIDGSRRDADAKPDTPSKGDRRSSRCAMDVTSRSIALPEYVSKLVLLAEI